MSIDLNDFPCDLIQSFDSHKGRGVIAFVGSGPSCHAGLPSWSGLIREIAYKLRLADEVRESLDRKDFSQVSNYISRQIGENNLKTKVVEIVISRTKSPSPLHEKIVNLNFKGIVTTNYDLLLTYADKRGNYSPPISNRTSQLVHLQKNPKPFVFHLHGNVLDPASIVLTLNSYNQILAEKSVRTALAHLFLSHDILFIGFGFADDHIENFLTEFRRDSITNLNVFAVIPDSELNVVKENSLRELNVTPIRLKEFSGDHGTAHLSQWLEILCDSVNQIETSKNNSARSHLLNTNLAGKIYDVISDVDYDDSLIASLKNLPNRLDLVHLCEMGLTNSEKNELLDLLSCSELRMLLVSANSHKPNLVFRDSLSFLPPENR